MFRKIHQPAQPAIQTFFSELLSNLGVLFESNWNTARFRCCLEQFGLCVQRTRRNMVGHSSFREGGHPGSKFLGCIYQFGQCAEGGPDFWQVNWKKKQKQIMIMLEIVVCLCMQMRKPSSHSRTHTHSRIKRKLWVGWDFIINLYSLYRLLHVVYVLRNPSGSRRYRASACCNRSLFVVENRWIDGSI